MVYNRWFQGLIVLMWGLSMGWLVCAKILPAMLLGNPPNYERIVEAQREDKLIGWKIHWNRYHVGNAITKTTARPDNVTEIEHLIEFQDFPFDEMFPTVWRLVSDPASNGPVEIPLVIRSQLYFDGLKRLSSFETKLRIPPGEESIINVRGSVENEVLRLNFSSRGFRYDTEAALTKRSLLTDRFAPQGKLPGLRHGQTWTIEVYSPFSLAQTPDGSQPLEILQAAVEAREAIMWSGRLVHAWVVVYRDDPGRRVNGKQRVRGRLWVAADGTVLRQEATLANGSLVLTRLSKRDALKLAEEAGMLN